MAPTWGKKIESSDGGQGGNWGKSDNKKVEVHQFGVKKLNPLMLPLRKALKMRLGVKLQNHGPTKTSLVGL